MTLKKYIFLAGLLLLLPLIYGCMSIGLSDNSILRGRVFKHYRLPYTIDLHNTPVTDIQARGLIIHVEEPISGYGIYTEFNSNAIGDIAKKHGLTKVYFADIEIFDVLGIWYHERLHIYGE